MFKHLLFTIALLSATFLSAQTKVYHKSATIMGCGFAITVVSKDSISANNNIQVAIDEIGRIEKKISSWDTNSITADINKHAGIQPIKVDKEVYQLIKRSIHLSQLTDGAFDISYASMDNIWKFDGSMTQTPSSKKIKQSVAKVGFRNIVINEKSQTVFLRKKGMKIGFGAIGKGYAADQAKKLLISKGVESGVINASGDIISWGKQEDGSPWNAAIINPHNKDKVFASSPLKEGAIVTSGNYEKFINLNGVNYSHIIDPKTGWPTQGIASVTIYAPKAELADALATAVFVMGIKTGIDLVDQMPNLECLIIDVEGKRYYSKGICIR